MSNHADQGKWRRWVTPLEVVAFCVGIGLLLWGADALSRLGAESLLERNIQHVTGVAEEPEVEIEGAVFLHQVIRGSYQEVHVRVENLHGGPLQVHEVDAWLYDVRMPFRDVILQDIRRFGVGRSIEQATLRFTALNTYFEMTGRPIRLEGTDDGRVRLSGSFNVLGQTVEASVPVDLSVDGSQLRITPSGEVDTGGTSLSPARRLLLAQRLAFTVPMDTLPFGHQLTRVEVVPDGLRIEAEGTRIVLRP